ncbi:sigma 54-interacting transcriptional regulator [Lactobacillus sp. ESL0679]|uniref:sigma 54-interacting transcriptional regulator n=1 Tax=Lactobacillus sp. ESL0679 TaxID=2983209 RepID=UPI0023FA36E9|nr:sigma 54-interacting transcriptional regulator [Lactobacillus sp. ESL0679]MDF7683000.1 sigma 54-interacting transcriptional regulator [Lactobacillus sp. ESL0679]
MSIAEKRVYDELAKQASEHAIPTLQLAENLKLSRSVVSHYLNKLLKERKVIKITGRPVKWQITEQVSSNFSQVFTDFIGYKGSMKHIIDQVKAAVVYPPNGLNILITGHSGVGKSYLANKIYRYSISKQIKKAGAPYITFNCANYADNPELISSTLFGYVKGAFTGANEETEGLLKQANGGFLFLDEVHRLSSENQEKLFSFIDTGKFYKIGDNIHAEKTNVRLIMATTEDPDKVLLTTFLRRIPVKIKLPDYIDRPIDERLELLKLLVYKEARKINKSICVDQHVVSALLQIKHRGNIGYIKNIIQLTCASAYNRDLNLPTINVTISNLSLNNLPKYYNWGTILVDPNKKMKFISQYDFSLGLDDLKISIHQLAENYSLKKLCACQTKLQNLNSINNKIEFETGLHLQHQRIFLEIIQKRYGLNMATSIEPLIFILYKSHFRITKIDRESLTKIFSKKLPRSFHIADIFYQQLPILDKISKNSLMIIFTILISQFVDENIKLRALMVAHGENTATSIQAVVNSLCENYIFDAIDMPIDANVSSIIKEANKLIDSFNTTNGFVLMIDMGSLEQLYSKINSHLDGDLLVINNLTTLTALDVAIKIKQNTPFKKIAEKADQDYAIEAKYYEGFSQLPNILVSCVSGLGIAEKVSEIIRPFMPADIKTIAISYDSLKEKIMRKEWSYFDRTLFVLTTIDITKDVKFKHMNLYNLLDASGEEKLRDWLTPYLSSEQIINFNNQIVRFFSKEGIAERLSFLNPDVVIGEVETIINKYELLYKVKFDGKFKLNLYMHIALMIERLMLHNSSVSVEKSISKKEAKFFKITHSVFQPIEIKYNIRITASEMNVLYELFSQFI